MSLKKKLGSKLAIGVRQVKTQREQASTVSAKTVMIKKTVAQPTVPAKPVAPRDTKKAEMNVLHPQRIWPD